MGYVEDVKSVAKVRADEIRGDLDHARHLLHQQQDRIAELERQIALLEVLLALAGESDQDIDGSPMTLHGAMVAVLREQPGHMLRPADLLAEINRRQLYRMRDGRAVELQQVHARVGNYPHLFVREGTFIKLVEG